MIYPISLSSDQFSDREKRFRFLFRLGENQVSIHGEWLEAGKSYESASRAPQVVILTYHFFRTALACSTFVLLLAFVWLNTRGADSES